jgi:hypothetical protein
LGSPGLNFSAIGYGLPFLFFAHDALDCRDVGKWV